MAIEQRTVFEGNLEDTAEGYALQIIAVVDFDAGSGDVISAVTDREGHTAARATVSFNVENPISTASVATAIGVFAACVAAGLAGVTATEVHKAYSESRQDDPNLSRSGRCRDVIRRLSDAGATLRAGATGAVTSCLVAAGLA